MRDGLPKERKPQGEVRVWGRFLPGSAGGFCREVGIGHWWRSGPCVERGRALPRDNSARCFLVGVLGFFGSEVFWVLGGTGKKVGDVGPVWLVYFFGFMGLLRGKI